MAQGIASDACAEWAVGTTKAQSYSPARGFTPRAVDKPFASMAIADIARQLGIMVGFSCHYSSMQLIQPLTLTEMAERVERICAVVEAHFLAARSGSAAAGLGDIGLHKSNDVLSPAPLIEALETLFQVLLRFESDWQSQRHSISAGELSELGDQGQQLLDDLLQWHRQLKLNEGAAALRDLAVPLALWLVGHGARLIQLETLVNQLAELANSSREPDVLAELDSVVSPIIDAIDDTARADLDNHNPQRPWRVLLLNHAIVATRTLDPERMTAAFDRLVKYLPDDAPAFFTQGMGQLDIIGYPAPVRDIMERYYLMWNTSTLH